MQMVNNVKQPGWNNGYARNCKMTCLVIRQSDSKVWEYLSYVKLMRFIKYNYVYTVCRAKRSNCEVIPNVNVL